MMATHGGWGTGGGDWGERERADPVCVCVWEVGVCRWRAKMCFLTSSVLFNAMTQTSLQLFFYQVWGPRARLGERFLEPRSWFVFSWGFTTSARWNSLSACQQSIYQCSSPPLPLPQSSPFWCVHACVVQACLMHQVLDINTKACADTRLSINPQPSSRARLCVCPRDAEQGRRGRGGGRGGGEKRVRGNERGGAKRGRGSRGRRGEKDGGGGGSWRLEPVISTGSQGKRASRCALAYPIDSIATT